VTLVDTGCASSTPLAAAVIAARNSPMVAKRCSRFLARAFITTASSSGSIARSGRTFDGGSIGSSICMASVRTMLSLLCGTRPVSIS
jgi:hypothetical protein